ncbi:DUF2846 domain-containing protein [Microbulbifer spongiae]|uniref:DUF2846 domain-containing protein n=1 Tax=Microbulbifer spongiae TaxID=2944933 RepID=A0ABY9E8F7_9GAMM|nr:DUF2846 domain-containing protein [Microbulbifer sp. MI-G]WKD48226.1 DUF2846 domain-containing protein [Microbulbifer sp. MI-G]
MLKKIIFFLLTWALIGCTATGPVFSPELPSKGKALIYVYTDQESSIRQAKIPPSIKINSLEIGSLKFKGHFSISVVPGEYVVTAQIFGGGNLAEMPITIEEGETKYLLYSERLTGGGLRVGHNNIMYSQSILVDVGPDIAMPILSETKLIGRVEK